MQCPVCFEELKGDQKFCCKACEMEWEETEKSEPLDTFQKFKPTDRKWK